MPSAPLSLPLRFPLSTPLSSMASNSSFSLLTTHIAPPVETMGTFLISSFPTSSSKSPSPSPYPSPNPSLSPSTPPTLSPLQSPSSSPLPYSTLSLCTLTISLSSTALSLSLTQSTDTSFAASRPTSSLPCPLSSTLTYTATATPILLQTVSDYNTSWITAIAGLVGSLSIVVLVIVLAYCRRQQRRAQKARQDSSGRTQGILPGGHEPCCGYSENRSSSYSSVSLAPIAISWIESGRKLDRKDVVLKCGHRLAAIEIQGIPIDGVKSKYYDSNNIPGPLVVADRIHDGNERRHRAHPRDSGMGQNQKQYQPFKKQLFGIHARPSFVAKPWQLAYALGGKTATVGILDSTTKAIDNTKAAVPVRGEKGVPPDPFLPSSAHPEHSKLELSCLWHHPLLPSRALHPSCSSHNSDQGAETSEKCTRSRRAVSTQPGRKMRHRQSADLYQEQHCRRDLYSAEQSGHWLKQHRSGLRDELHYFPQYGIVQRDHQRSRDHHRHQRKEERRREGQLRAKEACFVSIVTDEGPLDPATIESGTLPVLSPGPSPCLIMGSSQRTSII
ncbi:hypothetical protein BC939DRAFT_529138 [Gamsiella multidivaricata]|uniref:uncharacterized protein n=1 Tax=Gamsiella multidivaricata TaxID=101098 RepID=UPI0022208FA1|nr:uncharacterized protein BC939DRAFT_529138 [Gamsiella multidivaricata]KAI7823248.1 hypothetical protein BC939DRAFT_529138 [Gamsiella multidivaricata]